ncbi:MAG: hypothetical protein L0Z52_11505 [Acidobacteria bacterium]|nr:hypothetical protein [Acidobacteriota bacterium]
MAQRAFPSPSIDFRSRLLIDRHSSVLSRLSLRRQASLANLASTDATTWNIFRTLVQMDPVQWLPELMGLGKLRSVPSQRDLMGGVAVTLWKRVKPPAERLLWLQRQVLRGAVKPPVGRKRRGRVVPLSNLRAELKERARNRLPLEEPVEVDVIVKCPLSVLFLVIPSPGDSPEKPAESDASRTHLLRLVDAGLSYAETRSRARNNAVSFSLLIIARGSGTEQVWGGAIRAMTRSGARLRNSLPHREHVDLSVLTGNLGVASWSALEAMLEELRRRTTDELESALLSRLLQPASLPAPPAGR